MFIQDNKVINDKIIVALDVNTKKEVLEIVNQLEGTVTFFKVGLQLLTCEGISIVKTLKEKGLNVFLDGKFYDTPNTIIKSVKNLVDLDVNFITINCNVNNEVFDDLQKIKKDAKIIGIGKLTSGKIYDDKITNLMMKGLINIDGMVINGREVNKVNENLITIVPGINQNKTNYKGQSLSVTAKEAFNNGADYIVLGRCILNSKNKRKMLEKIVSEVE